MASFRFNKNSAAEFNLKSLAGADYYEDVYGNKWVQRYLWDNGWGPEFGFMKLPKPDFDGLWKLLTESSIYDNNRGAAELLNSEFAEETKQVLRNILDKNLPLSRNLTKRLSLLDFGTNRSDVMGKPADEVFKDAAEWKQLKTDFERLSTPSLWQKLFGK